MNTITKIRPNVKKIVSLVLILTLLFSTLFSGQVFAASSLLIPDINLANALSAILGKPADSITISDMQRMGGDLSLENKGITDLTGLQYATNVTGLDLTRNNISDISPIQSMTQIENLYITDNPVTNLSPLGNLTNLIHLILPGITTFTNWQAMSSLTKLQSLTAISDNINDLSFLQNMTNLQELLLGGCPITDAMPLANLHNLKALDLHGDSDISNVTPLLSSTGITFLDISLAGNEQQQNEQIQKLAALTAMESLQICHGTLNDISPLSGMTHLNTLIIQSANLHDISPLAQCHKLSDIYIDSNYITDLTPLTNLSLTRLGVTNNFINVFSGANKAVIDKVAISDPQISPSSPQRKLVFTDSQTVSIEVGKQIGETLGTYYTSDGSTLDSFDRPVSGNDVTLQSSDNSIATVFTDSLNNIYIKGVSSGTAQITAYYKGWNSDFTTATLNVKVNAPSVTKGSISGQITDATTGNPIPGATVSIGGKTVTTDAAGHYSFSGLALGSYTVNASANGYTSGNSSTTLKAGDTDKTVNIALLSVPVIPVIGSITGQITDTSTGNPIPDATVSIGGGKTVTADAKGHYEFRNIAVGSYMVKATATRYISGDSITNLTAGNANKIVNIALTPIKGSLFGQITDALTGNPIQDATVSIGEDKMATTDAAGYYSFTSLDLGNYTVNALADGYISGNSNTTLTADDANKTVNIALSSVPVTSVTGSITGQITDASTGNPIPNATVSIAKGKTATTDLTGHYVFSTLSIGSYTVNASQAGYTSGSSDTALTDADKDEIVNIALKPIVSIVSKEQSLPTQNALAPMQSPKTGDQANPFIPLLCLFSLGGVGLVVIIRKFKMR